jgi:amino acid adenylation domain-containing protein/non-ribosomal peptide synthase protein (TIGR01720 family)
LLCGIWAEVLGVAGVGVEENFFELGGDSILSIQIVARAARAGLRLTPKSLFQYQTVASLAAIAEPVAAPVQEELSVAAEPVSGPLPLTPIQQRFFALHRRATHHWNQSVLLRVQQPLKRSLLEQIVAGLLRQHDALRLRFARDEAGNWRQWYGAYEEAEAGRVVQCYDLRGAGVEAGWRALAEEGEQLQGSLELGAGPLLRVGYFELGGEERRLLLTIHHLVVDGVTWRLLLEDLERAYEQASSGAAVELGAKTSSYGEWARRLSEYARSERVEAETEYWVKQAEALRGSSNNGSGAERAVESRGQWVEASGSLTEAQTRGLLQEVGRAYGTRVTEVLLAGLLVAWEEWSGERVLGVDVEVHGREAELVGGVDVTRTAGWFTGVYPLVLALPGEWAAAGDAYGAVLKSVKEQLRAVPGGGLGYGLLRYLGRDERVRRRLAEGGEARLSFNYLGQFDGVLGGSEEFTVAWEGAGRAQAEESEREHELSVGASVGGGRLRVSVGYEQGRYAAAEIEQLVAEYVRVLGQLVQHCQTAGVGGYTPSDFPLINLGQSQLDQLVGSGRHVQSICPLSPIQEGLLFQTLYAPEAGVYFEQLSCVIRGDINVGAFEQAWQQLIERHTILRTAFVWKNLEKPLQVVRLHAKLPLRYEDWRSISQDEQTKGLEEFLAADRQSGFDLSAAPLMRIALLRVGEDSYRFVWSHHHLLLDGWSLQLLMSEVFDLYRALCRDEKVTKDKARPFEDYIAWLQRRDATEAETFWRETLKGFTSPTIIARGGKERELQIDQGYGELRALLPKSVTAQLQQMARSHQLTLNTVVQGAWALLLSRYSGESDVVFGATSSGRPAEIDGIESMVGLFINTLPVHVRVDEEMKLDGWLRQLQAEQAEMRQFEYSSLVEVQGWSEVPRGVPLFESLLAFENYPVDVALRESVEQSGVEVDDVRFTEATHYPLTVIIGPGAQLLVKIIYERSRYDNLITERMLKHFVTLLERMATEPAHIVSQLELLTDAERQTLIEVWNETQADYPTDKCLHEIFEEQSARAPDAVALVFDDQYLSYGQLNARANQLAHHLRKIGVGPETLVGILAERGVEMLVGVLGVLKAGGAYVPLDPAYPPERLKLMLEDSGAVALLTTGQRAAELPENGMRVLRLDAGEAIISAESRENPRPTATADNLLYVIYTSGSTGRPKGVAMRHGPLTNLITWQTRRATPSPARTLQFTSLSFDVSFQEIATTWCSGGTLVMISEETRRDAERLLNLIVDAEVERLFLPFVALQQLAEIAARKELSSARLREVLTAGEQLQVTARVIEMFSKLPGSSLHNQYGPAEAHVVTALTLQGSPQRWPSLPPIGRPVDNAHMYVLDARLRPVPVEVTGELYIGGDILARGYLNRPELTAERFIPDPFGAERGARLYRTGDSAIYLRDGQIEFLGRSDQQVKIRGFRIELGEIETVIATHEAVREAVVTADVQEGGTKRLIAYLVLHPGAQPSLGEVRQFLAERLPGYMVPSAFVIMDQLPLTPSGKVNRRALPAPSTVEREVKERTTVARGEVEELLCATIAHCLQIEHAGPDDNYFDLGGHSLLATQVISRIREAFGVELPLRALFESQTIADMAERIDELLRARCGTTVQPIQPLEREGRLPASFAQQRLWFLDQLEPNSALYNIPTAVRMQGRLDVTALERTLNEIVRRHEVLRTSFETFKGQPVQVIAPAVDVALPRIDLKGLDLAEQDSVVQKLSSEEARRPFDLSRDLLLRATLLQLGDEDHVVLFTMHHIISDGWSMGVFIKEVTALYEAFSENRPSPLPPLPIQYADFAVWQKEWMRGEVLERQLSYWKKQLGGSPSLVRLPMDRPRLAKLDQVGALLPFALSADASRSLKSFSRQRNVTLFMMLLAAFKSLLHSYSGQTELLVGTPVANRNLTETEPLVGFFVNTLVMRTDLSGNPTFGELLSRVREVVIQAHTNQDLPFEKLVAELQSERDLNRSPLFNVWFVLQNAPMSPLSLPGLTLSPMPLHSGTARYDLKLDVWESPEGLTGSFEYKAHLFTSETIARVSRNLEILLCYLPGHPDARLDELRQLLAEADKQHLTIKGREFTEARRQKLKNLQRQPRVTYSLSGNTN